MNAASVAAAQPATEQRSPDQNPDPGAPQMVETKKPVDTRDPVEPGEKEQLAPLFVADAAADFRARWDAVQIGFVDDPKQAVRKADELVGQVLESLAQTFRGERARIEGGSSDDAAKGTTTEDLRLALRNYRSFFQRLLSL
ncbi:hypothetical protein J7E62_24470 [Variovorax paradoxus]|nr:hypothetical protein [Variovorax paradoxus]